MGHIYPEEDSIFPLGHNGPQVVDIHIDQSEVPVIAMPASALKILSPSRERTRPKFGVLKDPSASSTPIKGRGLTRRVVRIRGPLPKVNHRPGLVARLPERRGEGRERSDKDPKSPFNLNSNLSSAIALVRARILRNQVIDDLRRHGLRGLRNDVPLPVIWVGRGDIEGWSGDSVLIFGMHSSGPA